MERSAIERLQVKSPEEAIIEQISRDFNLALFTTKTQFERCIGFKRDVGQMTCLAISTDALPGQPVAESKRVAINLTLDSPNGPGALRHGVAALRRARSNACAASQEQGCSKRWSG